MSDITATIRSIMAADGTIAATVGTRIYSDVLPQNATMPAITYFRVDTIANEHLTGVTDVFQSRIQIDCFADTRSAAFELSDDVRLALEQQNRGDNGGVFINEISLVTGPQDLVDRSAAGEDQRRFITSQDFFVYYRPSTS